MSIKFVFFLFVLVFLVSCKDEIKFEQTKIKSSSQKASLPDDLVKVLSKNFKDANPELTISEEQIYNKMGFYSKEVWPVTVKIWSGDEVAHQLDVFDPLARIDLNSYISAENKIEQFNFSIEIKTQKFNKLFVYFVPSLKNKNKKCDSFLDISTFYQEQLSKKVVLSKEDNHYLKNYVGTYVFFSSLSKDMYQLNVVQITDSSKSSSLCSHF